MNRADLDPLFDDAVQTACAFLEKNGEFFPFGVVLAGYGQRRHVEGWTGAEQPAPADVIDLLVRGFRDGAVSGSYRATALVRNVRVRDAERDTVSDAVCVTLEHEDGTCINCYLPYSKNDKGLLTYGEVFADPAEGTVFSGAVP